jgi:chloride channel 3/4/5
VSEWLADIKIGYCSDGWWLNQQFCCWEIEGDEIDGCESWHPWSNITLARWLIFVTFAVRVSVISDGKPNPAPVSAKRERFRSLLLIS